MIEMIYGKPGSGKSYYAMTLVEKELVTSHRNVVTNLPILVPQFNEYLQDKYPTRDLKLIQRLVLVEDKDLPIFYTFRGRDIFNPKGTEGVAYFLDEAHLYFNARKWNETADDVLVYLSQHRKLGDNVYCITQAVHKIDKQFRADAQDFIACKNEYISQYGFFKGQPRFLARWYDQEPNGWNDKPYLTEVYRLDHTKPISLANSYDTKKGFKIAGNAVGSGVVRRGISFYWFIPMAILGILLIGWASYAIPTSVAGATVLPKSGDASTKTGGNSSNSKNGLFGMGGSNSSNATFLVSYYLSGDNFVGEMSDGTFLTTKADNIEKVNEFSIIVEGRRMPLKVTQRQMGAGGVESAQNGLQGQQGSSRGALPHSFN